MTWYVVCDEWAIDPSPEDSIWTLSKDPSKPGWNTDSGCRGYGLKKADAEELAFTANRLQEENRNLLSANKDLQLHWEVLYSDYNNLLSVLKTVQEEHGYGLPIETNKMIESALSNGR